MIRFLSIILIAGVHTTAASQELPESFQQERAYLQTVLSKLKGFITLPERDRVNGATELRATIQSNGSVSKIEVLQSLGNEDYTEAIKQAILKAQPLPSPLPSMLKDGICNLTFAYAISKTEHHDSGVIFSDSGASTESDIPEKITGFRDGAGRAIIWRRMHSVVDISRNQPDPFLSWGRLINPMEGDVIIYTASRQLPSNGAIRFGKPGMGEAYYALMHIRDNRRYLLPLNFDPNNPGPIYTTYPLWTNLKSRYDAKSDRYLLFLSDITFTNPSGNQYVPSWEHFDAWWLDLKTKSITHIVLPPGPWVTDAHLDTALLRVFQNAPCGIGCFRHYDLKIEGGNIFVSISGKPSAVSEGVTGTYQLKPDRSGWEKLTEVER